MKELHELKLHFNHVYIIQSLDEDDNTGKWLFEDIMNYQYKHQYLKIEFKKVENASDFFEYLNCIQGNIIKNKRIPFIHIEAHGDKNGFEFRPSKDYVEWAEVLKKTTQINVLAKNNLVLALGICYGALASTLALLDVIDENVRSPFLGIIGASTQISNYDIKNSYSKFYHTLFETPDMNHAIRKMHEQTPLNLLQTSNYIIEKIVNSMHEFIQTESFRSESSEQLNEILKSGKDPFPGKTLQKKLKLLKKHKKEFYRKELKEKYEKFLMIDCYEENRTRFKPFEHFWGKMPQLMNANC